MSDTPRTSGLQGRFSRFREGDLARLWDLARDLERELTREKAARHSAETALNDALVENDRLRSQLTAGPDKILRCAFCGEAYPEGTPTHKHEALVAHIRVCREHPIGKENATLREDKARLDSGSIRLIHRDEFGHDVPTIHSEIDLRAAIDAARAAP